MKKILIALIVIAALAAAAIFIYRYQLVQYSADKIIRGYLPDYVRIDKINFDAKSGRIVINGFKILNPPHFSNSCLIEMEEASCGYRMKGKTPAEGFEILDPVFNRPILNIERLGDGRCNLSEIQALMIKKAPEAVQAQNYPSSPPPSQAGINPAALIKLPEKFLLKDGRIIFTDRFRLSRPHLITFENVNSEISVKFDDRYSRVLGLSSTGEGLVSGHSSEVVRWVVSMDPTAPRLTMSNRFEVWGVEILPFEPYYDRYSPFVFRSGTFSGTLIFDFDNGSLGSTNEIHLEGLKFYVKPGYENAQFWDTTVPDLIKYFTSSSGEIVFDFKIKGDMENPRFYLGPISKQALAAMAIDKISQAIEKAANKGQDAGGPKSDLEKAKEYIDLFKGMIKK
ncbi:MAG: DUF748 domain-containing protein [Candidatus Omnitrophota bacterium]